MSEKTIEELLLSPYWVIDILPKQVPPDSPGQYFAVEKYYLDAQQISEIKRRHLNIILKLNCYLPVTIDDETCVNPPPERIAEEIFRRPLLIRTNDALIQSEPDDTCLTVYNPDPGLLDLLRMLSLAEGMFLWKPPA